MEIKRARRAGRLEVFVVLAFLGVVLTAQVQGSTGQPWLGALLASLATPRGAPGSSSPRAATG